MALAAFVFFGTIAGRAADDASADADKEPVDLMLVLATDVSASIQKYETPTLSDEYAIQKDGLVSGLRDPEVHRMLEKCAIAGVAITYMEWSGQNRETQARQILPWTKIETGAQMTAFADEVAALKYAFSAMTDIITALLRSADLIRSAPFIGARQVIQIASDGDQGVEKGPTFTTTTAGQHELLAQTRDELVASGLVIDAIVIGDERSGRTSPEPLPDYFHNRVEGGPGSSTEPVRDARDYARGFKRTLLRELNYCGY